MTIWERPRYVLVYKQNFIGQTLTYSDLQHMEYQSSHLVPSRRTKMEMVFYYSLSYR